MYLLQKKMECMYLQLQFQIILIFICYLKLKQKELILAQKKCSASIVTALVRPIILQLGADAQWFFRDLDASVIQSIIDAANAAHE